MRQSLFLAMCCVAIFQQSFRVAAGAEGGERWPAKTDARLPHALAKSRRRSRFVRVRSWFSSGSAAESIGGIVGPLACPTTQHVNVLSELTWRDTKSIVTEVSSEFNFSDRWAIQTDIGFGGISEGEFRDIDYCDPNRQSPFSHTLHPATGDDLFYVHLDLSYQVYAGERCTVDLFAGHQFWRENYVASNGVDLHPGTRTALFQGKEVISQKFQWTGLRLGGKVRVDVTPRLNLQGRLAAIPIGSFRLEDVHFLRDDLKKDPSIIDTAHIHWGVAADVVLAWRFWRTFSVEIGYQLFHNDSKSGKSIRRGIVRDVHSDFNGARTSRHGVLFGIRFDY